MRHRRLLLALPLGFFACLSNNASNGNDDGGGPDLDASFDSASPPMDAAPGIDAPTPVDAPTEAAPVQVAEASVDAPVDSPPPALTVVVGGLQGLESGVSVVWSNASGVVLGTSTTDATGSASSTAATVSMATVVMGTTSQPYLYTAMGLQLGQSVLVADVASLQSANLLADITSVPSAPTLGDGGVLGFSVMSGACQSSGGIPETINLTSSSDRQPCLGYGVGASYSTAFPVLVEAQEQAVPLGFAFSKLNSPTAPDDAGQLAVALANPWKTTMTTQTLAVSNASGSSPQLAFSEVADGVLTPLQQYGTTLADGGPSSLVYTHTGFADDVQFEASFGTAGAQGGFGTTVIAATSLPPTTSGTMTLDATPVATAPVFQTSSVSTTTSQLVVSWTLTSGTLAASTAVIAAVTWNGTNDGGAQNGVWSIVSPGTAGASLTAPALPASLSAFTPPAGSSSNYQTLFAITGQGGLSTYESLLPSASLYQTQSALCGFNSPTIAPLAGIGSVVMSAFTNEGGC